jgi:hypothetical protein
VYPLPQPIKAGIVGPEERAVTIPYKHHVACDMTPERGIVQSEKRCGYSNKLSYDRKTYKHTRNVLYIIYKIIRRTFSTELWR